MSDDAQNFTEAFGEQAFNPEVYTQKELLKVIWKDVQKLNAQMESISKDTRVEERLKSLEDRLTQVEVERTTSQRNLKIWMSAVAIVFTAVNIVLNLTGAI